MSAYFIKHPVIATVIAVLTTVLGVVCLMNLPIAQYPEITPRTINLTAMYPGADAQAVADSVGTPIERQMNGIQHMDYMTSVSSNNGVYNLQVVFEPDSDTDIDQVLTNMRYGQAQSQVPTEVLNAGITIRQQPGLPLMIYSLTSPDGTYDAVDLANYAQVKLMDEIKRVPGVGEVTVYGAGRYAIRIWLDTVKMAHFGLSLNEVQGAVRQQNVTNPGGKVGADPVPDGQENTITIRTQGRLSTTEEFENIIVRQRGDEVVYLKDIATLELGSENYSTVGRLNRHTAASIIVFQSPGSNAIDTVDRVSALLASKPMPPGIRGDVSLDTTTSVRYSIEEIYHTFIEAVVLVALVVFLFLQNWRATLIPLIAVPVSLISTFCVFPLLGFTLNTISLLGMVLAIGLVVDDAIVVVEAVQHHIDKGLNPRMAAFAAMQEVSGPVIAIAFVLAAVFLPSLMLEGITGTLFKQFAITIAISMLISAFNALTLSPALCALMLKSADNPDPAIKNLTSVVGINILNMVQTPGAAIAFVQLKDWSEREESAAEVQKRLNMRCQMAGLDGISMVLIPPAIPGVGTANGVTFILTDLEGQGVGFLHGQVQAFKQAASARPEVSMCTDMMMADVPQKYLELDRAKCQKFGVNISDAYGVLASYYGSSFVNFFNAYGQQWQVYMQARGQDRVSLEQMSGFFVINNKGEKVPLDAIISVRDVADTEFVMHHNGYNAAKLNIMPAPGYSTQQLMDAMEEVYAQTMDNNKVGMDYQDMSFQENKVRNSTGLGTIFLMSGFFAFLILAALYEKWTLPISVFMTVPIAVLGAYIGLYCMQLDLNLYAQVGLVMLVGLAAKNAILIVEFANLEMERGMDLMSATLAAARLRLRPIIMTSLAFILGCIPLVISSGSGALARNAIGIVVVVGMAVATFVGVFLIPCSYVAIMRLFRIRFEKKTLEADPDEEGARRYLVEHSNDVE